MTATVFFCTSGHGFGHAVRDAARFYAMFDERADREAAALQETRVDLVVGDIPPLAFEAAGRAGIPSIAANREGLMWGETNDGNSHHAGGTAGNAGLFATARAVFRLAQSWANAELLPRDVISEATRNQTPGLNKSRGLGWQISPTGMYGHTGFTGTSVWIDPERDRIIILLTNRVHPCAAPIAMQRIRGEFHRLAAASSAGCYAAF